MAKIIEININKAEVDSENITESFAYPKSIINIIDSLYDSGKDQQAEDLLDFLDEIGELAVNQLADLHESFVNELPLSKQEDTDILLPVSEGAMQLQLYTYV